jgi:hypothetical protein
MDELIKLLEHEQVDSVRLRLTDEGLYFVEVSCRRRFFHTSSVSLEAGVMDALGQVEGRKKFCHQPPKSD